MTSPEANLTDLFAEPNEIREALKAAFGGMNAYCSWWPTRDERGPRFSVSAQCRYGTNKNLRGGRAKTYNNHPDN